MDSIPVDSKLVGGEGTSLVRAQDGNTGQLLNSGDTGDDSLVLGELLSTDCKGDRKHGRHGNGDTTDQEDKNVIETTTVVVTETGIENKDFCKHENTDRNEAERTDLSENLLQVTGGIIILTNK